MKYTKELLEEIVPKVVSVAGLMRELGVRPAGGTHSHLSRKIKQYEIDTSHFLGQAANQGSRHKGGPEKRSWEEVLIKRCEGGREKSFRLRRALIESGREYKCEKEICGNKGEWLGEKLMLQVNHKNRDWLDDRGENLEFLCPNCHTQTTGHNNSKGLAEVTTTANWDREHRKRKHKFI